MFKFVAMFALAFAGMAQAEEVVGNSSSQIDPSLVIEARAGGQGGGGFRGGPSMGTPRMTPSAPRMAPIAPRVAPRVMPPHQNHFRGNMPGNQNRFSGPARVGRPHGGFPGGHRPHGWIRRGHRGLAPLWFGGLLAGGYIAWRYYDVTPYGYWQCIAYNETGRAFPAYGVDANQAADQAMDRCERESGYGGDSCFIPEDYCRIRQ